MTRRIDIVTYHHEGTEFSLHQRSDGVLEVAHAGRAGHVRPTGYQETRFEWGSGGWESTNGTNTVEQALCNLCNWLINRNANASLLGKFVQDLRAPALAICQCGHACACGRGGIE